MMSRSTATASSRLTGPLCAPRRSANPASIWFAASLVANLVKPGGMSVDASNQTSADLLNVDKGSIWGSGLLASWGRDLDILVLKDQHISVRLVQLT